MASEEEDTEVSFHPRYAGGADPEMSSSSSDDEFSDASDQVMHVASETPGIEMGDAPERHDQDPFYPCHMGDVASLARGGVPRRQAGPETSKFIAPDPPRSSLNRGPKTNEFPSKGGPAIISMPWKICIDQLTIYTRTSKNYRQMTVNFHENAHIFA